MAKLWFMFAVVMLLSAQVCLAQPSWWLPNGDGAEATRVHKNLGPNAPQVFKIEIKIPPIFGGGGGHGATGQRNGANNTGGPSRKPLLRLF
ncbi:unnamed protein product [Anisakis simplex]|uniref:Secreted protein n=1 Tax=Anisakis simplex TaxID=6269 RepID=A0A0M3J2C4_ANISI|nr:unnamed protein product [Anisakis simplex]